MAGVNAAETDAPELPAMAAYPVISRRETDDAWFALTFSTLRGKGRRATGEAHLLDVADGATLVSAHADAAPRDPLNLFDDRRNPERELLAGLVQGLTRRLAEIARPACENERSIAG